MEIDTIVMRRPVGSRISVDSLELVIVARGGCDLCAMNAGNGCLRSPCRSHARANQTGVQFTYPEVAALLKPDTEDAAHEAFTTRHNLHRPRSSGG
jgi:hypothetical protein